MSPTTTTTTTTTTEPSPKQKPSPLVDIASKPKPTLRIFGKRCEEVQCDRASSTGCFYEDNRIAKCKCKQGFKNHGRFVCKGKKSFFKAKYPKNFFIKYLLNEFFWGLFL